MKTCELCKSAATTYCESDQASLCWDCDAKVHGANFLVVRHVRFLLCHTCQSRTPWRAAGSKLGHIVSVCQNCANGGDQEESEAENEEEGNGVEEDDDVSDGDDLKEEENQVVPWSTIGNTPPPASSSSSCGDDSAGETEVSRSTNLFSLKRSRGNASDLHSQDDMHLLSPKRRYCYRTVLASGCEEEGDGVAVDSGTMRLPKEQGIKPEDTVQFESNPRVAKNIVRQSVVKKIE